MQRYAMNSWFPAAAMVAAAGATIAMGSFVHVLFVPAPTAIGAQAIAAQYARPASEVAILPSRIDVIGVRAGEIAGSGSTDPVVAPRG